MTPRRPRPAAASSALPTLGALLGGAAALSGCHEPVCGSARVDELRTHATDANRALRDGRLSTAGRDIAVALGITPHGQTLNTEPQVAGAMPIVQPPPPPIPEPEMLTGGVPAPVDPPPPPPPETNTIDSDGAMPAVQPTPPTPQPMVQPSGGAPAFRPTPPQPVARTRGGVSASNPVPPVLHRRSAR